MNRCYLVTVAVDTAQLPSRKVLDRGTGERKLLTSRGARRSVGLGLGPRRPYRHPGVASGGKWHSIGTVAQGNTAVRGRATAEPSANSSLQSADASCGPGWRERFLDHVFISLGSVGWTVLLSSTATFRAAPYGSRPKVDLLLTTASSEGNLSGIES